MYTKFSYTIRVPHSTTTGKHPLHLLNDMLGCIYVVMAGGNHTSTKQEHKLTLDKNTPI